MAHILMWYNYGIVAREKKNNNYCCCR